MNETQIKIVFVGHVDHGKSSVLGRLLVETDSLPDGKLDQVKRYCENHARDFEYAYLIDSLEKEQSQGITIDSARYFIRRGEKQFLFIDTPGHLDFIKNMITGSSLADIGLLIVDAKQGIEQNTLRHIFLLSFLQIRHVIVLINKMDQVQYSKEIYMPLAESISAVFKSNGLSLQAIIPISAKHGENFLVPSSKLSWYHGLALWPLLNNYSPPKDRTDGEFRMSLQDIYRFSQNGDDRRIYAGTIASGSLKKGDRLFFSPSGKEGIVASIESDLQDPSAGHAIGFTLANPIFVERGELISRTGEKQPEISTRIQARLFWISAKPISLAKTYALRLCTNKVDCRVEEIVTVYDSATLKQKKIEEAAPYDIIECILAAAKPVAFDESDPVIRRFVLVDQYEIVSNGVVLAAAKIKEQTHAFSRLIVLIGSQFDLNTVHKEESSKKILVYPMKIENFEQNHSLYLGMFKVCRELSAVCLVQIDELTDPLEQFFHSQFKEIEYRKKDPGKVFWFTGLPCSGKTTIGEFLLKENSNFIHLDGDLQRNTLSSDLGFSMDDRRKNLERIAALALDHAKMGKTVLVTTISPLEAQRSEIRMLFSRSTIPFHLVYISTDLSLCLQRDVKGMYAKAKRGEIEHFTGISSPYEPPKSADLVFDTQVESLDQIHRRFSQFCEEHL